MNIQTFLFNRRNELGLTLKQVAEYVGVSESTVSRWESGNISNMKRNRIYSLCKILQIDPSIIMGWSDEDQYTPPKLAANTIVLPVIGEIAAGYNEIAIEDWTGETVEIPLSYLKGRSVSEFFVLKVHGDSMYPLYHSGDKALILKQNALSRSGEIGAIIYGDNNATLKKIEYAEGQPWMKLIPINPNYPPLTIEGEDLNACEIIGIPKLLIREIQ